MLGRLDCTLVMNTGYPTGKKALVIDLKKGLSVWPRVPSVISFIFRALPHSGGGCSCCRRSTPGLLRAAGVCGGRHLHFPRPIRIVFAAYQFVGALYTCRTQSIRPVRGSMTSRPGPQPPRTPASCSQTPVHDEGPKTPNRAAAPAPAFKARRRGAGPACGATC